MENEEHNEPIATAEQEQPTVPAAGGKTHWSGRPLGLLLAVLAAKLVINLVQLCFSLPLIRQADTTDSALSTAILIDILTTCATLLVGGLFYWRVRVTQKRHGVADAVSWRPGVAFWVGIVLVLSYAILTWSGHFQYQPVLSVLNFISQLVSGLTGTLFLVLLFPVIERRFGIIKGALLLSASFAPLAVLESLVYQILSFWLAASQGEEYIAQIIWSGIFPTLLSTFITTATLSTVRVALYLIASRRVPGTWMLFASVPGLLTHLYSSIREALENSSDAVQTMIKFLYYLLVFGISMGLLAGFQKWKTPLAFRESLKALAAKTKYTQEDVE